ncbi:MAG TPA: hypothetical protein VM142_11170 [Acidimicrobiales bacterium]|nr:hypothetical protein [Acidimicrobiales bacterium]
MIRRSGLFVAIAVVVILGVGVVYQVTQGDADGDASPVRSTPTTASFTSTTQPPLVEGTAPALVNTGDDFAAIIRSFVAYQDWVGAHPDPALLGETIDSSCPCLAPSQQNMAELKAKGWRYEPGVDTEVQEVKPRTVTGDVVDVFVAIRYPERKVLDATDRVVKSEPAEPPTSYFYTLRRGGDGRWRITEIQLGTVL